MPQRRKVQPARRIIGNVSVFEHHGAWWMYYNDSGKAVRRRAGANLHLAECEASLVNAGLAAAAAGVALESMPAWEALGLQRPATLQPGDGRAAPQSRVTIPELRQAFLAHHRNVLHSSLATVARYTTATLYLEQFAAQSRITDPTTLPVSDFVENLRTIEVAPNGHAMSVDRIRTSFIIAAKAAGLDATCPKSWRHSYATVLQQANVDLLVRQLTMGHQPASAYSSPLAMTARYTHTSPAFSEK